MGARTVALLLIVICVVVPAGRGGARLAVDDPDGVAGRTRAPCCVDVVSPAVPLSELALVETRTGEAVPCQFDTRGRGFTAAVWWLMPPGPKGKRLFELRRAAQPAAKPTLRVTVADAQRYVDIHDGKNLVLRFNFATVPVPEGIPARYARGGYIHPLCGPDGEALTEDYPRDHAHHRGVMWTWPVCRWKGKVTDPWAVSGCWTRPEKLEQTLAGPVFALVEATSVWKWGDKEPIVREQVVIRAFRQVERSRLVDITVRLTALVDEVSIGGRPRAGYGGFGLRMAPRKAQKITLFTDPPQRQPRRSWIDYSDTFAGGQGRVGVAILQHIANPLYPAKLHQYPGLNYVMPAFPGPREIPLPKGQALWLRHRLWIHPGHGEPPALADHWAAYARAPGAPSLLKARP